VYNITPNYDGVCARRQHRCIVDGYEVLFNDDDSFDERRSSSPSFDQMPSSASSSSSAQSSASDARCIRADDMSTIADAMKSGLSFATASEVESVRLSAEGGGGSMGDTLLEPEQLVVEWRRRLGQMRQQLQQRQGHGVVASEDDECIPALALKLRFHIEANDSTSRQRSVVWQDAFIETMKGYHSDIIDVAFVAADSLQVRQLSFPNRLSKFKPWSQV
jgi:hypothetical protein